MILNKFKLFVMILIISLKSVLSESDIYIQEVKNRCYTERTLISCVKYRGLKYLASLTDLSNFDYANSTKIIKLVKIPKLETEFDKKFLYFPSARQLATDGELNKLMKFVQRRVNNFLESYGLSIRLPYGMVVINEVDGNYLGEARKKKKKLEALIPLIILFKLFKINVLSALILIGVAFIKKALIIAAALIPSLIHSLKSCQHRYVQPKSHVIEEVSYSPHVEFESQPYHQPQPYQYHQVSGYENGWQRTANGQNLQA